MLRVLHRVLLALGFVVISLAMATPSARADVGLGGGAAFDPGSVFPLVAGQPNRVETSFFVQNLGETPAELELDAGLPVGLSLEALIEEPVVLDPGGSLDYEFAIVSDSTLSIGRDEVIITVSQVNVTPPSDGGSVYAPAIGGRLVIEASGASATITVSAVSDITGSPAVGTFGLFAIGDGPPVRLETAEGTGLARVVPPGEYRVTFEVPGLNRQSRDVTVSDGDEVDIVLEIPTVAFDRIDASPTYDDSGEAIITAELSATLTNNLRRLAGPLRLEVEVRHNGERVDTVELATFPELARGQTSQRTSYRPEDGFSVGRWDFSFALVAREFRVEAARTDGFDSRRSLTAGLSRWWVWILVVIIGLWLLRGLWWFFVTRRRRDEDDETMTWATSGAGSRSGGRLRG